MSYEQYLLHGESTENLQNDQGYKKITLENTLQFRA